MRHMQKLRTGIGKRVGALLLLLALLPGCGQALRRMSVTPVTEDEALSRCEVSLFESRNRGYFLFLPGHIRADAWHVWLDGAEEMTVGETVLCSGEATDLLRDGASLTARCDGRKYGITVMQGSPLPALYIHTASGSLERVEKAKANKEAGTLLAVDAQGNVLYDGALEYIKIRGNSSLRFSKKNYAIKLDRGTDLFGMGKAKRWVLTGNARDRSLVRNQIALELARFAGLAYTPEFIQTEVYINGEYRGVYLFSEKVEIQENRIAVRDLEAANEELNPDYEDFPKPVGVQKNAQPGDWKACELEEEPEDITGGYLVEMESYASRYGEDPSAYRMLQGKVMVVKSPEYASEAQMRYISGLVQAFENAIFSPDGRDPETGKRYDELADADSLVRKFMIEEISKNYDGDSSSQFFYKPADGESEKLFCGPVWDYDAAFGAYGHRKNSPTLNPEGYQHTGSGTESAWWPQLFAKEDFRAGVRAAWRSSYGPALEILLGLRPPEGGLMSLEAYISAVEKSAQMNFLRWPIGTTANNAAYVGKTFAENTAYLSDFLARRYAFLQGEWGAEDR